MSQYVCSPTPASRRTPKIALAAILFTVISTAAPGRLAAASSDLVFYASDVTTISGNWARVSDGSAAGGQMMASTDYGWSTTNAPLAAPNDYFELPFTAPANTPYRVWLRLRASGNSKYNDSVWVQYSDASSTGGTPVYAIGSTSGAAVNLEPCSGCGVSGWGWVDGAYWLSQATTVVFASSGSHTLRVQTREDGVQIDQIVLSPATWLSSAPGQRSNDTTIVPKPASSSSTGSASTPFFGSPAAVPGTIEAENFDNGGEGVAYHDTTSGNSGGAYRSTDVDIEPSTTGAYDVGWVAPGEWLKYTVNVASAGNYAISFLVASQAQGGTFHLEMNGTNVTGSLTVPNTGSWQSWQTVTASATLSAGTQVARLVMDTNGAGAVGNFGSFTFAQASVGSGGGGSGSLAYSGTPVAVPGRVEAENFDTGGRNVSYYDTTSGNAGGAYRATDVDIEASSEGGYDVGWTAAGEWMNYTVNVASAGSYTAQLRVASATGGGALHIGFNGASNVWTSVSIPSTGGWQSWTTVIVPVTLGAGTQQITIYTDSPGYNISYIDVTGGSAPASGGGGGGSSTGSTITVPAGGDLQAAINNAQPGDTILLLPGVTYNGAFILPAKGGSSYITIRSAAPDSALPAAGQRITPSYESQLPIVKSMYGMPAFSTAAGAHHYRLQFLELLSNFYNGDILELGDGSSAQNSLSQVPHDLTVDRCYIHGDPTVGQKRGIALNSASTIITGNYISDIKSSVSDAQTIAGWNGPGPFTITNNYLEATGENVLFGGADPSIYGLVPSDITIQRNHITKLPSWVGQGWTIKNLVEFKNAQRVTLDSNIIEYNWAAAQSGYAILFTPRNQNGTAPWTVVQHIQVTNNVIRHVAAVFNVLGYDDANPSQLTNDITVRNNLFSDVSAATWGGSGRFVLTDGGQNLTFNHNTVFTDGTSVVYADVTTVSGFVFTNNMVPDNGYAIMGSGSSPGTGTLTAYYPGATFLANVVIGANTKNYPTGNYYPATAAIAGLNSDGTLSSSSPYLYSATDGTAVGCNVTSILSATSGIQ